MISSGIETETFLLTAKCLSQLRYRVSPLYVVYIRIYGDSNEMQCRNFEWCKGLQFFQY
jgi:hypothetical protein